MGPVYGFNGKHYMQNGVILIISHSQLFVVKTPQPRKTYKTNDYFCKKMHPTKTMIVRSRSNTIPRVLASTMKAFPDLSTLDVVCSVKLDNIL